MSGPPRKRAKLTETTKSHRYETFTKRIANIKIDPVHKVQSSRITDDRNDLTKSFFRSALDEWVELNLTTTFTSFFRETSHLTESLPQLLHHADRVVESLLAHIEKKHELSLEPLLSLVAHLAHDLGQEFSKYAERTIQLVASVAASIQDPAAIEQCFTCLAWLYKYLSRILVQDLRPLLTVLIPYMSMKKEYIRRFTAESLAYLVRKAALLYTKNGEPLRLTLKHLFDQLDTDASIVENISFQNALMTLLTESMMGVEAKLHATSTDLLSCSLNTVLQLPQGASFTKAVDVLEGATIALIHQTNAEGFQPALHLLVNESIKSISTNSECSVLLLRLLLAATGVRKGSRVDRWTDIITLMIMQIKGSSQITIEDDALTHLSICATVFQYAPLEQLLPHVASLIDAIDSAFSVTEFLLLCEVVAESNRERFLDFLLAPLQRCVNTCWKNNEAALCYVLQSLHKKGLVNNSPNTMGYLASSAEWDRHIILTLSDDKSRNGSLEHSSHLFQLMEAIQIAKGASDTKNLSEALSSVTQKALERNRTDLDPAARLSLGWALSRALTLGLDNDFDMWSAINRMQRDAFHMRPFLDVCRRILSGLDQVSTAPDSSYHLRETLVENMLTADLDLRKQSIELLSLVGKLQNNSWLVETSTLLLEIIETPYLPSNVRKLGMLLRKLPQKQKDIGEDRLYRRLIPLFGMSMLRHYHDQVRHELCHVLKAMAADTATADTIVDICVRWLQFPGVVSPSPENQPPAKKNDYLSSFECSNLNLIKKATINAWKMTSDATNQLQKDFELAHQLWPPEVPPESRSIALQVLLEMPDVIERRSRSLTPIFLVTFDKRHDQDGPSSDTSTSSHTLSLDTDEKPWSLKDRKLFLELISKFVNPRVLFRSGEMYNTILEFLANGNVEIRKYALTSILNWKDPTLSRYDDILLKVAEEKSATTELAALLNTTDEDASIKSYDRSLVLPVLLRLIFGQLVGRSGSHGSQESKRKTILRLLFRMDEMEVLEFLKIALGRLGQIALSEDQTFPDHILSTDVVSTDQQYGFLRMMLSMMDVLQTEFTPYCGMIATQVLYCTARASRQVGYDENESSSTGALTKNIRRTGLQCLTVIFEQSTNFDWFPYLNVIFRDIVRPRLENFASETTQGVSTLLRLIAAWASRTQLMFLLRDYEPELLPSLWNLVSGLTVRKEVKIFVIEKVIAALADSSQLEMDAAGEATTILKQQIDRIFEAFATLLESQISKELLLSITNVIPQLANFASTASTSNQTLSVLIKLLCQPHQRIPPHIKAGLLRATESLLVSNVSTVSPELKDRLFDVVSGFYNYFRDYENRETTGKILHLLSEGDLTILHILKICSDLNAFDTQRLGTIDFDKRLSAYTAVNEIEVPVSSRWQMLPVIQNLLFFSRTAEDFSIRSNAVSCMKRYTIEMCQSDSDSAHALLLEVMLPAIEKGLREESEMVRADFVLLLGLLVKYARHIEELHDMKVLLVGEDEEASFFNNILHIQQHRRTRAIRRLVAEVEKATITPNNITRFFLPLLEKFANDASGDDSASGTKGHSIAAIADLLKWVDWKVFRKIFRQFRQDLDSATKPERDSIKLLNNAADSLTYAIEMQNDDSQERCFLSRTLPSITTVGNMLKEDFIPKLGKFIHYKDEAEISLRIPASKVAVKLIKFLPDTEIPGMVTPIILDIAQILRSRAQDSRDIARNTLADIVSLLGPSSLQFVLKELRTTLSRGYQLHVLSYTMHTILLVCAKELNPGDLDYCVDTMAAVIMDDIFGAVGQEKENQDYISTMKEVKSSKSYDSMELLAQSCGLKALFRLVEPFKSLLIGTLSSKQLRQVDDLLRRMGVGISHNPAAKSRDLLVFSYELIQAFYQTKATPKIPALTNDEKNRQRFLVQLDGASRTNTSTSSSYLYKLARFSLDMVRSTLHKQSTLLTAENIHGFLPIIGDAIVQGQEDVKISAFRLLAVVMKLPLRELDENSGLYIMEAVRMVKSAMNTNEEGPQAALKLVTTLMRERRDVSIRDADIAYLLRRTMPDLEEPDRQGITFNFVKAVMVRKAQLPELYEVMDKIAVIMVTNHTKSARDAARAVLVFFLLDYPQSEKRWAKQLKFLLKNLDYDYPEGRQSVMETVNNLIQKLDGTTAQDLITAFFIPILLRMANDDHLGCRELAGALLSQLFRKSGASQLRTLLEPLRNWIDQTENTDLTKLGLQAWNLFFEVNPAGARDEVPTVRSCISRILGDRQLDDVWEIQFQALELLSKLVATIPEMVMTNKQREFWTRICSMLLSTHTWIRFSAAGLIESFLDTIDVHESKSMLVGPYGLKFDPDRIIVLLRNSIRVLKRTSDSQELARKTNRNLLFLGRWTAANRLMMDIKSADASVETGDQSPSDSDASDEDSQPRRISAIRYLFDQLTSVLRREPKLLTAQAFVPRLSALQLLLALVQELSISSIAHESITALLMPLTYITDAETYQPRSADPTFPETYTSYTESAQLLLEALQSKLGDATYVKLMTDATRTMRKRREERRQKRAIERVSAPEKAARDKRRKVDRRKERRKEIKDIYRKGRRKDLGF